MKKIILILVLLLLCGCKSKYIICNIKIDNNNLNYNLEGKYKIHYKKTQVTKIEKEEIYSSDDPDVIKYLDESKDIELSSLKEKYNGYTFEIKSDRKNVKIKTNIDVKVLDLKQMVKDEYLSKYYVNKNKLTLGGIKLFYESRGAECE